MTRNKENSKNNSIQKKPVKIQVITSVNNEPVSFENLTYKQYKALSFLLDFYNTSGNRRSAIIPFDAIVGSSF